MRAVYLDLDGTLLGRDGASDDGRAALEPCCTAGVEVVLMSGRARRRVAGDARRLGLSSYVCEAGAGVVADGRVRWLTGDLVPSARHGTVFDQIEAGGAPALLLRRFAGRLEPHDPWHRGRDVSHLFRGRVDVAEGAAMLAALQQRNVRIAAGRYGTGVLDAVTSTLRSW